MPEPSVVFPPIESADDDGFLAWGGDLEPETLRLAYQSGIFPWPMPGAPLLWFAPPQRAILRFADFHVSHSLKKQLRRHNWQVRIDTNFRGVIQNCARAPRLGQQGTWIIPAIQRAYSRLHDLGEAHSVEVYLEDKLVGGLYGVNWGGYFAGESMFHLETSASKVALCHLVQHLSWQGIEWLDCEVINPLFASFGAVEIPREDFMQMLDKALQKPTINWQTP